MPAQFLPGGLTEEEAAADGARLRERSRARRKKLLAEAGYPDGFSMDLITSEMTDYRANYECMQAELAEIGITINLKVVDHATMHSQIREGRQPDRDLRRLPAERRRLPDPLLPLRLDRRQGREADHQLLPLPGIDDLIEQARAETDAGASRALWKQAKIQILEDMVALSDPVRRIRSTRGRRASTTATSWCRSSRSIPGITEKTRLVK